MLSFSAGYWQVTLSLIERLTLDGAVTVRVSVLLQVSDVAATVSWTVTPPGPACVVPPVPDDQWYVTFAARLALIVPLTVKVGADPSMQLGLVVELAALDRADTVMTTGAGVVGGVVVVWVVGVPGVVEVPADGVAVGVPLGVDLAVGVGVGDPEAEVLPDAPPPG